MRNKNTLKMFDLKDMHTIKIIPSLRNGKLVLKDGEKTNQKKEEDDTRISWMNLIHLFITSFGCNLIILIN